MNAVNYSKLENIKSALDAAFGNYNLTKLKPYIWQDEISDVFFITKKLEFYFHSSDTLCCLTKNFIGILQLQSQAQIQDLICDDDRLYSFKISIDFIPLLLNLGKFVKRPHKNGRFIRDRERWYGHSILPYKPKTERLERLSKFIACHCPIHHFNWKQPMSAILQCPQCKAEAEFAKQMVLRYELNKEATKC